MRCNDFCWLSAIKWLWNSWGDCRRSFVYGCQTSYTIIFARLILTCIEDSPGRQIRPTAPPPQLSETTFFWHFRMPRTHLAMFPLQQLECDTLIFEIFSCMWCCSDFQNITACSWNILFWEGLGDIVDMHCNWIDKCIHQGCHQTLFQ